MRKLVSPKRLLPVAALLAAFAIPSVAGASTYIPEADPGVTRPAILIGNNWDGTTDIVDPDTFERLDRINVVPDRKEREASIAFDPVRLAFYGAVRVLIGEGHHQFNDDVFSSHDGRTIFVSRPSFADVIAIDLATKKIKWRAQVDGYRSDHMAISADGKRLYVSASTGNVVHEIDTVTGLRTGGFDSGDSPHETNISRDGTTIYHASIGRVYLPVDRPRVLATATRGGEFFQIVDRRTGQIKKRIVMSDKMEEAGFKDFSAAMRPMALTPDEKTLYFQLSFFHGFVEYDLVRDKVTRVAHLPVSDEAAKLLPEQYLLDSAHHGLALDSKGDKLCVAGTMSDYAAIVDRKTFARKIIPGIEKPYWSTDSADGRYCYVSASGEDEVAVISYDTEQVVHKFKVGWHPQRVRNGLVTVSQYPQGKHGERFRLGVRHAKSPLKLRRGKARFTCRAERANALRIDRCRVRITRGKTLVAVGERFARDRKSIALSVKATKKGRRVLRKAGKRGMRVRVTARGVDNVGRVATKRKLIRLR